VEEFFMEVTVSTLLDAMLNAEPSIETWSPENLKKNLPEDNRLQIIDVLSNVFLADVYKDKDFPFRVNSLLYGDFTERRSPDVYAGLFSEMEAINLNSKFKLAPKHKYDDESPFERTLDYNYTRLFRFKRQARTLLSACDELLRFNSGILEISYPYFPAVILTNKVIESLDEVVESVDLHEIDKFLCTVIDPWHRSFSEEKLIKEMGYPILEPEREYDEWD
jgi:hypothetical protein